MYDSLALLVSGVLDKFGPTALMYLKPIKVLDAAMETLAKYGLIAQQSEHGRVSMSVTFTPTSREVSLDNYTNGMSLPSYVERKTGLNTSSCYEWIPAVMASRLDEYRESGDARVSFVRTEEGLHVMRLSYDPGGISHRLTYSTNPQIPQDMDGQIGTPNRFWPMLAHATFINVVPTFLLLITELPKEEKDRFDSTYLAAIGAAVGHSKEQIRDWEPLFKIENSADPNPRGRMRRPILGRLRSS